MTPQEFLKYRKGMNMVLTLLDLEAASYQGNKEVQDFVTEFITKYQKEI